MTLDTKKDKEKKKKQAYLGVFWIPNSPVLVIPSYSRRSRFTLAGLLDLS